MLLINLLHFGTSYRLYSRISFDIFRVIKVNKPFFLYLLYLFIQVLTYFFYLVHQLSIFLLQGKKLPFFDTYTLILLNFRKFIVPILKISYIFLIVCCLFFTIKHFLYREWNNKNQKNSKILQDKDAKYFRQRFKSFQNKSQSFYVYFQKTMQKQDFGEKAQKLYERLTSLSTPIDHRKQSMPETLNTSGLRPHTKYSQTISDLMKFEHDLCSDEQSNCKKIKQLNQEIKKMESYLNQENESRIKINEHFIHNTLKIEKNMQNALEGVKRVYGQREKKMEDKLEQIIKAEKKILEQHIDDDDDIENEMHRMNEDLNKIKEQLTTMKKNRIELEDKIYTQFSQQMKELRTIFNKTNQKREQRETKVLSALKRLYKKTMDSLRSEEVNRQASEKLFLSVIEKLIDRIKAYQYNMMLWGEKEKMDINLSKFLCGIGQICPICKSRLKSYEAISICRCFLFTHEACIVKVLEPLVQPNRDFLCSHCSYTLQVKAKMSYSYEPRLSCSQLCAFIIGLLCVLFITLLTLFGVYDRILPHTWCLLIAGFFGTLLFLLFLYTIRKLVIKDLTIIPTNLLNKSEKVSIDFTYQREQGVQSIV